MSESDTQVMVCECSHPSHQIMVNLDHEDKMVYFYIHLNKLSFLERLKYLLGFRKGYGAFEEFIFTKKHVPTLEKIMKTIK